MSKGKAVDKKNSRREGIPLRYNTLLITGVLLLTLIVFYPSINNTFTSWDDPLYVTENNDIKKLSIDNIIRFFSIENPVAANYHPLTMISLAIDYSIAKLNPSQFHLTNLLFHLLNTFLVFIFIYRLTGKKLFTSLLTSALFAIHPMHVESVAWISERKDVLYVFFFLLGLITYLKYNQTGKNRFLAITFLFFVLSVLSKAMAVVFPVVMLLIDYYQGRKITLKLIVLKIPFLTVSVLAGLLAVEIQSKEAIAAFETFSIFQRLSFGFYGIGMYLWKLILPVNLSSFYPYPLAGTAVAFPITFYLPSFIGFITVVLLFLAIISRKEKLKPLVFGLSFFLVTVFLVLQFISVGQVIIADRYTYLSYIGLFFIIGYYLDDIIARRNNIRNVVYTTCVIVILVFSNISINRIKVWKNSDTLWSDVIEKYPYPPWTIEIAYVGRGKYYATELKDMNKAYSDFKTLELMNSKNYVAYSNLGNIYGTQAAQAEKSGDKMKADELFRTSIEYYNKAIKLDSSISTIYLNRATAYIYMKNYPMAAGDFEKALSLDPANSDLAEKKAYALFMSGDLTNSLIDYNQLIRLFPGKTYLYLYRGITLYKMNNISEAINDLKVTIQNEPKNGTAYHYLSLCYIKLDDYRTASIYKELAAKNGYVTNNKQQSSNDK